jgi:para-nitrobenzyl esterase
MCKNKIRIDQQTESSNFEHTAAGRSRLPMALGIRACAALMLALAWAPLLSATDLLITTEAGIVQGAWSPIQPSVRAFLGIPYGKPPIGALRWAPPRPAASWAPAVRNATSLGFACPQQYLTALGPFYGAQSEDCLSLNVWAPSNVTHALPVLVWIYGGGYVMVCFLVTFTLKPIS